MDRPTIFQHLTRRRENLRRRQAKGLDHVPSFLHRNYAVPIGKDRLGYYDEAAGQVGEINEREMSATFIVNTLAMDRDGDVVMPQGCLATLGNYARNPVVFFDHQKDPLPIAVSEDKAGKLRVSVMDDKILATGFFHDQTKCARDVWNLVSRKVLRGASLGFAPTRAERMHGSKAFDPTDKEKVIVPRYRFLEWDLLEWSICGIPINPEALRIEMSAGRITDDVLRKSLAPYAEQGKSWSNGAAMKKKTKVPKTKAKPEEEEDDLDLEDEETPAEEESGTDAEETPADEGMEDDEADDLPDEPIAEEPDEEKPKEEKAEGLNEAEDGKVLRPGAMMLADLARHHMGVGEYIKEIEQHQDHPELLKWLAGKSEKNNADLEEIHGLAAKHYPDVDFKSALESPDEEEIPDEETKMGDEGEEETMPPVNAGIDDDKEDELGIRKSRKAPVVKGRMNKATATCIKDAAEYMQDVGSHESMPKMFRGGHKYHAAELMKAIEQPGPANEEDVLMDEEKAADLVRKSIKELREAMNVPAEPEPAPGFVHAYGRLPQETAR